MDKYKAVPGVWTNCGWVPSGGNVVAQRDGYYLSYNRINNTTAICGDNGSFFFIMVGDHRSNLAEQDTPSKVASYFGKSTKSDTSEHKQLFSENDILHVTVHASKVFTADELRIIKGLPDA